MQVDIGLPMEHDEAVFYIHKKEGWSDKVPTLVRTLDRGGHYLL